MTFSLRCDGGKGELPGRLEKAFLQAEGPGREELGPSDNMKEGQSSFEASELWGWRGLKDPER